MGEGTRGGHHTHWVTYGAGDDPALLMHCTLGHSGAWRGFANDLSDLLCMTAFDLPGHGRAADWSGAGDVQGLAAAMAADFLDRPTHLIGHSFGATVALRVAVEHPELVKSLTLIEPVYMVAAFADDPALMATYRATHGAMQACFEEGDYIGAARVFTSLWSDDAPFDAMTEAAQARMAAQMKLVEATGTVLQEDVLGWLGSGALERISCPTLLVAGAKTLPMMKTAIAGLARRIPTARSVEIAGAGHMAPLTHPRDVAAQVRGLIAG